MYATSRMIKLWAYFAKCISASPGSSQWLLMGLCTVAPALAQLQGCKDAHACPRAASETLLPPLCSEGCGMGLGTTLLEKLAQPQSLPAISPGTHSALQLWASVLLFLPKNRAGMGLFETQPYGKQGN